MELHKNKSFEHQKTLLGSENTTGMLRETL